MVALLNEIKTLKAANETLSSANVELSVENGTLREIINSGGVVAATQVKSLTPAVFDRPCRSRGLSSLDGLCFRPQGAGAKRSRTVGNGAPAMKVRYWSTVMGVAGGGVVLDRPTDRSRPRCM